MAKSEVISHWHHRAEDFNTSSLDFYGAVRKELEEIKAPVRFDKVEWSESGVLSAKRTYLRVEFNRLAFDICAAPFGKTFFFSWWLAERAPSFAALFGCFVMLAVPGLLYAAVTFAGLLKGVLIFAVVAGVAWLIASSLVQSGLPTIEDAIIAIPVVGWLYARIFKSVTYYAIDTRIMFEETVHETVLKVVDGLLAAKGAKALSAEERKSKAAGALR